MKNVILIAALCFASHSASAQEDSVKTSHEKFYQPVMQTEAPEEVIAKKDVQAPPTLIAPKHIETKKIKHKKSGARKE